MASSYTFTRTEFNQSQCVNEQGGLVSITVPSAGTILVTDDSILSFSHVSGTSDEVELVIATSAASCAVSQPASWDVVPSSQPTGDYQLTASVVFSDTVAAGSYTFYVNVDDGAGASLNHFWGSQMVAEFFPS
ncbi:MAG: hypothetical protein ACLQD8_07280 [Thermoplasmata archaeon]